LARLEELKMPLELLHWVRLILQHLKLFVASLSLVQLLTFVPLGHLFLLLALVRYHLFLRLYLYCQHLQHHHLPRLQLHHLCRPLILHQPHLLSHPLKRLSLRPVLERLLK
jgi:hypothetical protein